MNALAALSLSAGVLVLFSSVGTVPFDRYRGEEGITATLHSDRAEYYVGEALQLQVVIRNDTSRAFSGGFRLRLSGSHLHSEIHFRRSDRSFSRLELVAPEEDTLRRKRGGVSIPVLLEPGTERTSEITIAWDGAANGPVLAQPGVLEFKVAMYAAPDRPRHVLWSNTISIRVVPPAPSEQKALDEFLQKRLPYVTQSAFELVRRAEMEPLNSAVAFLDRHPSSAYSAHLRNRLVSALDMAAAQNNANREQRRILKRLKDGSDIADPAWSDAGISYKVGDQVTHDGQAWKCIQAHRSQADWAPLRAPALWVKAGQGSEWDSPVRYSPGDEVTYQGATYTCRQVHTSQAGSAPPDAPALWSRK